MIFILKYYHKKQDFIVESISGIVMVETCQYRLVRFNGRQSAVSIFFFFHLYFYLSVANLRLNHKNL